MSLAASRSPGLGLQRSSAARIKPTWAGERLGGTWLRLVLDPAVPTHMYTYPLWARHPSFSPACWNYASALLWKVPWGIRNLKIPRELWKSEFLSKSLLFRAWFLLKEGTSMVQKIKNFYSYHAVFLSNLKGLFLKLFKQSFLWIIHFPMYMWFLANRRQFALISDI